MARAETPNQRKTRQGRIKKCIQVGQGYLDHQYRGNVSVPTKLLKLLIVELQKGLDNERAG